MSEQDHLSLIRRREVEAEIVGPLLRGFIDRFGRDETLEVAREVIAGLARSAGANLAGRLGDASLETFAKALDLWKEDGALEIEVLEQSADRLDFNVTRCRYAETYRALGLADLGATLSCLRDYALIEGFNPNVELTRTDTLMEGAPFCDFRFRNVGPSIAKTL